MCVVLLHLVSIRTFGVMYDHSAITCKSADQISGHMNWAVSLVILHMVTSIFLWILCAYIWINILTLSLQRESTLEGRKEGEREREREREERGGYII